MYPPQPGPVVHVQFTQQHPQPQPQQQLYQQQVMCSTLVYEKMFYNLPCSKLQDKVTQSTLATLCLVNTNSTTPINHCRCLTSMSYLSNLHIRNTYMYILMYFGTGFATLCTQ